MQTPQTANHTDTTGAGFGDEHERARLLAELRGDLAALVGDVSRIVETRAAAARDATVEGAERGLAATRDTIRAYPVAALATALIAGAALAVILTPAAPRSSARARLDAWTPDLHRADFDKLAKRLSRAVSQAAPGPSLTSAFERVVESMSSLDAKSSLAPAIEKAGAWLSSMRASIGGK